MLSTSMLAFAAENDYTVESGDYLKKIAKKIYGDSAYWEVIYDANKDTIKNPNLIYTGQVLVIPDLADIENSTATTETTAIDTTATPATEETTPITEAVSVKNVPVGTNPVYWQPDTGNRIGYNGYRCDYDGYRYTYIDGTWISCQDMAGHNSYDTYDSGYVAETVDAYGVTYRVHYPDMNNAIAMEQVANYIGQNPDSNLASLIRQHGDQVVIVLCCGGLWHSLFYNVDGYVYPGEDHSTDYGIVDCEPKDCVYLFVQMATPFRNDGSFLIRRLEDLSTSVSNDPNVVSIFN